MHVLAEQYLAYLRIKKGRPRSEEHIGGVRRRLTRMMAGCTSLDEVTAEHVERRMGEILATPVAVAGGTIRLSTQTVDAHRRDLGTFFRWLVRRRLYRENPVEAVDPLEPEDPRRQTRPFSPDEARAFFIRCPRRRLAVYVLWATSGLRPRETRRLLVGHFVVAPVDGCPPYVQMLRATSKNRKSVRQPLHPDALRLVAPLLAGRADGENAFPVVPDWRTFRDDLTRCGLPTKPSAEGSLSRTSLRKYFATSLEGSLSRTSLRKYFATSLDRLGNSDGLVQKLMRHSSPVLTRERYTHFDLTEKARAVAALGLVKASEAPPWTAWAKGESA